MKLSAIGVFTVYLLLISVFLAFSLQLPASDTRLEYTNNGSSQPLDVGSLEFPGIDVTVTLYILFAINQESDTITMVARLGYVGQHLDPNIQPKFSSPPNININNKQMHITEHTVFSNDPRDFRFGRGFYDIYKTEIDFPVVTIAKDVKIDLSAELSIFNVENDSLTFIEDYTSVSYTNVFIQFNKTQLVIASLLIWLVTIAIIRRVYTSSFNSKEGDSRVNLLFVGHVMPLIVMTQFALFFAPLNYVDAANFANESWLIPKDQLIINGIIIISFVIIWYMIIPLIIDGKRYGLKILNFDQNFRISTTMLQKLKIPRSTSEKGFFLTIQERTLKHIFYGAIVIQVLNVISLLILIEVSSLAIFIAPLTYLAWVIKRESIYDSYLIE